jgi:hypothetical protein
MNWKALVLVLCLVALSYTWAQGHIDFICETHSCGPGRLLERDWTFKVGPRSFGFAQHRDAQDLNGKYIPTGVLIHDPENYRWHQRTTVHLGFIQFTTRGTAAKSVALACAFPLVLGFSLFLWKRSRKG